MDAFRQLAERVARIEQALRQAHILGEPNPTPNAYDANAPQPTAPTTVVAGAHPDWSAEGKSNVRR